MLSVVASCVVPGVCIAAPLTYIPFDPAHGQRLAAEGEAFHLFLPAMVVYGAKDRFVQAALEPGEHRASNAEFGGDPIPSTTKSAYMSEAAYAREAEAAAQSLARTKAIAVQKAAEYAKLPKIYVKPFASTSLWNSRPINVVLGEPAVEKNIYFPAIADGAYSTGAFLAKPEDPPVVVTGVKGGPIHVAYDYSTPASVTIAHWPAELVPASGSDGHADIFDIPGNKIHSFWQLRFADGQWHAAQYSWTALDGTGFGSPQHPNSGARAAGVVTSAGLIRKQELFDGKDRFEHALAMSLPKESLSANPPFVFPATACDTDARTTNSGSVPQGARLMLPASFDTSQFTNPTVRKVAETLKTFGAYVVDRNVGTPYVIYVENGSGISLMPHGWDNKVADQLQAIRAELRPLISAGNWIDGDGRSFAPRTN